MKYTDPSGFFFKKLFKKIKKWIKPIIAIAVAAVVTWATGGIGTGGWFAQAWGQFFGSGALVATGAIMTGSLKGAVFGAISAGIANEIGNVLGHDSSFFNSIKNGNWGQATAKAVLHGISRAAITKAQGGRWSAGFWSGFASSGFSVGTEGYGGVIGRTTIMGIVGGTVSEIAGGKFANGAVTGAFVHLFNAEGGLKKKFENFINRIDRALDYSEIYYDSTMESSTVLGQNIGEKISGMTVISYKNNELIKNIFYKN